MPACGYAFYLLVLNSTSQIKLISARGHVISSIYFIKVSGIPSGNKLIKTIRLLTCEDMISAHVKISMISLMTSSLSLKLYLN